MLASAAHILKVFWAICINSDKFLLSKPSVFRIFFRISELIDPKSPITGCCFLVNQDLGVASIQEPFQEGIYFSWLSKFCCVITIFLLASTGADTDVFIYVVVVRLFKGKYSYKVFTLFSLLLWPCQISWSLTLSMLSNCPILLLVVSTEWPLSLELPREFAEHPLIILCPIHFYPHFHLSGPSCTSCMFWHMLWKGAKLLTHF